MASFPQGAVATDQEPGLFFSEPSGALSPVGLGATNPQPYDNAGRVSADSPGVLTKSTANLFVASKTVHQALEANQSSGGFDWFEDFHVIPRSFDFGNLLSNQSVLMEVFNAFRNESKQWTTFVNNAGVGTTLSGQPTLPASLSPMSGTTQVVLPLPAVPTLASLTFTGMKLEVSTLGEPFVDSTLVFTFIGVGTATVPITIQRIVLWGLRPELPFDQFFESLTDINPSLDGTEKRASVRKRPRQSWQYAYKADEGVEAQTFENLLFDFQSRTFGVPVWFDDSFLTAAVAIGATSITVNATAFRDYRVGGLVVILTSQQTFDVLEVATSGITATTLTFTSAVTKAYAIGTEVFPLVTCLATPSISGGRWTTGLRSFGIEFESTQNDVDLGSLTAFSTYKSKLLLDVGNSMSSATLGNEFRQPFNTLDGGAGLVSQLSTEDRNKRSYTFTMRASGREAISQMRGLAYAINGRRISFYVPTSSDDLVVVANLVSAANTMDVTNVGYAQFVRDRQPKSDLRVNFADGITAPLLREITASAISTTTVDQLTVDVNWPSTFTPAQISRVEYVEKVRFDTDRVRFQYDKSGERARMIVPVVAVFE